MIVKRTINELEPKKVAFDFDNGDLQVVEAIMQRYRFINEQAMFRFALVILLRAENNGAYIDEAGKRVFISPSDSIINPPDAAQQNESASE